KYHGWSLYNEWWVRDLNNFRGFRPLGAPAINNPILYTMNTPSGSSGAAFFGENSLVDFGMTVQSGYFIVPKKLELAGRYSFISGVSGDINGNGTFVTVPSTTLGIKQAAAVGGVQP